jgi:hypothetical protein
MRMCQSAFSAVGVRSGSMTTTCAPFARASSMKGQSWIEVESTFAPQRTTSLASGIVSGAGPWLEP